MESQGIHKDKSGEMIKARGKQKIVLVDFILEK